MSRDTSHQTRLLNALSNLALNTSRAGTTPTSLGNKFQCLTTFTVKEGFRFGSYFAASASVCCRVR